MGIYNYIRTALGLGVGAQNMAFVRPQSVPMDGIAPGNHFVRGQLSPLSQGAVKMGQTVVPVSLLGDHGGGLPGQLVLGPLARPVREG